MELIIIIIALIIIGAVLLKIQFNRSVKTVIALFIEHNALDSDNAKSLDELGFKKKSIYQTFSSPHRDYQQYALQFLIHMGVLLTNEDNRLYLSEEKLASVNLQNIYKH